MCVCVCSFFCESLATSNDIKWGTGPGKHNNVHADNAEWWYKRKLPSLCRLATVLSVQHNGTPQDMRIREEKNQNPWPPKQNQPDVVNELKETGSDKATRNIIGAETQIKESIWQPNTAKTRPSVWPHLVHPPLSITKLLVYPRTRTDMN